MRYHTPRLTLRTVQRLEAREVPAVLEFTLVQAQSSVTLSGEVNGLPASEQGPGSLTTSLTGAIRADVDLAANTINFISDGTVFDSAISGNWQPLPGGATGSAPADFGGRVVLAGLVFAIRNSTGAFSTSTPLTLSGTSDNRSFPSMQLFTLVSGNLDFNAGILGMGTQDIGNNSTNNSASTNGSFVDLGDGKARLTTPLTAVFMTSLSGIPATFNLTGSLQSLAPFPTVDPNGPAAGFDTSVNFASGGPAVTLAPNLETRRMPSADLQSATITLSPRPDGAAESLAVTLSGGLTSNYDSGTGTLTITGPGSLATYQTVLRTVTYANSLPGATPGTRTVTFVVNDGTIDSLPHVASVNVTGGAAPTVTEVTVNDGQTNEVQRSRVTSIDVTFSAQVTFAGAVSAAFGLSRIGGGAVGGFTATASVVGGVTVVRLSGFTGNETNFGSLADGRFSLLVRANQVTVGGVQLDGDGNGTGGDDYTLNGTVANKLFRLFGDVNADGTVNASDFSQFRPAFGSSMGQAAYVAYLDFNGDGSINASDFAQFRPRFGGSVP